MRRVREIPYFKHMDTNIQVNDVGTLHALARCMTSLGKLNVRNGNK